MEPLDGGPSAEPVQRAAVERAWNDARQSLLRKLSSHLRDRDLAEDSLQDALEAALRVWPRDGVPESPEAWLLVTARRKAVDRLRRSRVHQERVRELAAAGPLGHTEQWSESDVAAVADDHLRLIFTCCHPALSESTRVALTLRTVCGLSTAEVGRALLVSEATMSQRLSRARRKIKENQIPYRVPRPDELPERLSAVLATVYLIFNEGYSRPEDTTSNTARRGLCAEAVRLARRLVNLFPSEAEAHGLLALLCLLHSRSASRIDPHGSYVPLDRQDRTLWNYELVHEGVRALRRARATGLPGPYQVQAAIAAVHADVSGTGATDWRLVADMYELLYQLQPSPVVEVNRAVALARAGEQEEGLSLLRSYAADPELEDYQPLYAALAELLRGQDDAAALEAYDRAIQLAPSPTQAEELTRRKAGIQLQRSAHSRGES